MNVGPINYHENVPVKMTCQFTTDIHGVWHGIYIHGNQQLLNGLVLKYIASIWNTGWSWVMIKYKEVNYLFIPCSRCWLNYSTFLLRHSIVYKTILLSVAVGDDFPSSWPLLLMHSFYKTFPTINQLPRKRPRGRNPTEWLVMGQVRLGYL